MDLSHATWIPRHTLGGTDAWVWTKPHRTTMPRGINTTYWFSRVPAPAFAQPLFPAEAVFDVSANVEFTLPCNFIMHFQVYTPGRATDGPSNGQLLLDTHSSQAVTPRDEDWVDYYYSWGTSMATDSPGMSEMLLETVNAAFVEDKVVLEAQWRNVKERPHTKQVGLLLDTGPEKMLSLLDTFLAEEAKEGVR
jgi:vanillate O-demethylase monooxygenase subunit